MSDDLISRSALKKEFDDKCAYECAICKYAKDFAPCKLIDDAPTIERPQGERAERALAIIDRLRTDGHINNKEQGTLRRAILLPERLHGEWIELKTNPPNFLGHRFYICSKCNREIDVMTPDESLDDYPYCHCGACMIKEEKKL